jgi:hypothetical protein
MTWLVSVSQTLALRAHRRAGRSPDSRRVGGATMFALRDQYKYENHTRQPKTAATPPS